MAVMHRRASLMHLLDDLYDGHTCSSHCSIDSESWTDASTTSEHLIAIGSSGAHHRRMLFAGSFRRAISADDHRMSSPPGTGVDELPEIKFYDEQTLRKLETMQLQRLVERLRLEVNIMSQTLIKFLKRREYQSMRMRARCNVMTAVLQARSPKRSIDAKLQFTLEPPGGENGYEQWLNAMRAVARLPDGMPMHFRKKLWLTLADHYFKVSNIDWEATRRRTFNDRMNPDDDELSLQIVKDLHRTGWSGLDRDMERVLLKRVLLAYARYNKDIGYCQGFNVIAALLLEVMEYQEDLALKVMILLIEHVLPSGYFDQTLRALSVDMAVLRDLVQQRLPRLSAHLDHLQKTSESEYEPPLTNVFSMQWFLTLFVTCLPKQAVFRIWDSLMLEGSEILLRTALAIWLKIGRRVCRAKTADSFYSVMGVVCQDLLHMPNDEANDLLQVIYSMAEFPYPGLKELRLGYTYNIQPFSSAFRLLQKQVASILKSDDENGSSEFSSRSPNHASSSGASSPASSREPHSSSPRRGNAVDVSQLEKQYRLMRQRQKQAAVILQNALSGHVGANSPNERRIPTSTSCDKKPSTSNDERDSFPGNVFNHLYLDRASGKAITRGTANGNVMMAPHVVQPSGESKRPGKTSRVTTPQTKWPQQQRQRPPNLWSVPGDPQQQPVRRTSCLDSPPSTPTSQGSSTPTSSADSSTPRLRTPALMDDDLRTSSPFERLSMKRHSSADDLSASASMPAVFALKTSRFRSLSVDERDWPIDCFAPIRTASTAVTGSTSTDYDDRLSPSGRRPPPRLTNRPPPLDLSLAKSLDLRSKSSSSPRTASSTGSKQKESSLLRKSKAILASIHSADDPQSEATVRNPFPVKRQTTLIERGKRLGLYS